MKASTYIDLDSSIFGFIIEPRHVRICKSTEKVSEDKNRVDPRVSERFHRSLQTCPSTILGLHSGARKCQYRRCDESFERNSRFLLIQDPEFENIDWD
jgi:hypothetical protein